MEIPENVKRETTKCQHAFECLDTGYCGHEKRCEVEFAFGPEALGLKLRGPFSCPYHESFGDVSLCTCPVRYFLYTNNSPNAG